VLEAQLLPVAVELLSHGVAERLFIKNEGAYPALLIRYAGMPETVAYQRERSLKLLRSDPATIDCSAFEDDADYWRALSALPLEESNRLAWRASLLPTEMGLFLERAMKNGGAAFSSSSLWHAGIADGRVRVMNASNNDDADPPFIASLEKLRALARTAGGALVIENAPQEIKNSLDAWGDAGTKMSLMRRVKKKLDPHAMLSPGRFSKEI
jgi:FAD/FMN-containing dehydrogenase